MRVKRVWKLLGAFLVLSSVPSLTFGQGAYVPARSVNSNVNGVLRPVAGATITVCAAGNANVPCAPPLAGVLFKDQALTQPLANPTTTDLNGNYPTMALAAGNYTITETAVGFTGFSYQITITCGLGGCAAASLTVTGTTTLSATTVTTLTVSGKLSCKNFNNVPCVDGDNSQGWAGTDFGSWVNSAIASLPVVLPPSNDGTHKYPTGRVLMFPATTGAPITVSTTIVADSPSVQLVGPGSSVLQLTCPASGDCIRMKTTNFNQSHGALIQGLTLLGNATATSGLHIGDLNGAKIYDVTISGFTSTSATTGLGSTGAAGLWIDNVSGFTENLEIIGGTWLINNQIAMKETNSAAACPLANSSASYMYATPHINVGASQIGLEIGPGIHTGHNRFMSFAINGNGTGKTFFQMDGVSGSCGASTMNNSFLQLSTEDDGPAGGTFMNMAAGTSLSGPCLLSNFVSAPAMTNTLNGTLACQNYIGPNGNQWITNFPALPAADTSVTVPLYSVGAPGMGSNDLEVGANATTGNVWFGTGGSMFIGFDSAINSLKTNRAPFRFYSGSVPTCTFTSGGGTSPSCAFDTGSTNQAGIIIATAGTGAPAASGTITLTFDTTWQATFGANKPSCLFTPNLNGAGQWNARATIFNKTPSTASSLFQWDNNAVALSVSTAYWIDYFCAPK